MKNIKKHINLKNIFIGSLVACVSIVLIIFLSLLGYVLWHKYQKVYVIPYEETVNREIVDAVIKQHGDRFDLESYMPHLTNKSKLSVEDAKNEVIKNTTRLRISTSAEAFYEEYQFSHASGRFPNCAEIQELLKDSRVKKDGNKCNISITGWDNAKELVYAYDNKHLYKNVYKNYEETETIQCYEVSVKDPKTKKYVVLSVLNPYMIEERQEDSDKKFSDICIKN